MKIKKAGRENPGLFCLSMKSRYVPGTTPRTVVATIVGEPTVLKRNPPTVTSWLCVRPVMPGGVSA